MSTSDSTGSEPTRPEPSRVGGQLTRKQRQVLTAIQRFSTLNGYMPSVRELGRELGGLAPATVQHHLSMLRRKGHLEHDGGAHGLRLSAGAQPTPELATDPADSDGSGGGGAAGGGGESGSWGMEIPGMQVVVPLLGTISAGKPLEAVEESDEYVPIPASLARGSCFVLRVAGDSMVEDAILDGDLVVLQSCEKVDDGEVAVALLPDDTATLKRVYVESDRVRLQPANSSMEPLYADEVRIRGRVVGLVRQYPPRSGPMT
jgi:repressor LexA